MSRRATQPSLFDAPPPAPTPVDPAWIRRSLLELLYLVRTSVVLPWSEPQTQTWEGLFRDLAPKVPDGEALYAEWQSHLKRLRSP